MSCSLILSSHFHSEGHETGGSPQQWASLLCQEDNARALLVRPEDEVGTVLMTAVSGRIGLAIRG